MTTVTDNSTNANWSTKGKKTQPIPLDSRSASFHDIMWPPRSRRAAVGGVSEERSQFRAQWTSQRWLICPYLWSIISGMENVLSAKTTCDNPNMSHVIRSLCLRGVSPVTCWPVSSLLPHTHPATAGTPVGDELRLTGNRRMDGREEQCQGFLAPPLDVTKPLEQLWLILFSTHTLFSRALPVFTAVYWPKFRYLAANGLLLLSY